MARGTGRPIWMHAGHVVGALDEKAAPRRVTLTGLKTLDLTGEGQCIAVYDTGLDAGENQPLRNFDAQRVKFLHQKGETLESYQDVSGHGTHVAGTIAHVDTGMRAGVARNAYLLIQSQPGQDFLPALETARENGANIHNNSWANTWYRRTPKFGPTTYTRNTYTGTRTERDKLTSCYDDVSLETDRFAAEHRTLTIVAGASNEGPYSPSIGTPGTAKNIITVGSCRNDVLIADGYEKKSEGDPTPLPPLNPNDISLFSSRGPTDDGRIKPDVVAPGECILAPFSQYGDPSGMRGILKDFCYSNGTSMATPVVSGCAALLREWLAAEHKLSAPSSALLKAFLINGAVSLPNQGGWGSPNQGWGRVNLENIVSPPGGRVVWFHDETLALAQGQTAEFQFEVSTPSLLKVTLVWLDAPLDQDQIPKQPRGPQSKPGEHQTLVNDLDLRMIGPDEAHYVGNHFDTHRDYSPPVTQTDLVPPDSVNNVECIILDDLYPQAGTRKGLHKVQVTASKVVKTSKPEALEVTTTAPVQTFALVISGVFDPTQVKVSRLSEG